MATNHVTNLASDSLEADLSSLSLQSSRAPAALTCPSLLATIVEQGVIHGLAVHEDELFVLTCSPNKIKVYSGSNFELSRKIPIDELKSPQCMDICKKNNFIYISDYSSCSVYKLPTSSEVIQSSWRVSDGPRGLFVSNNGIILVIIENKHRIEEYTPDGEMVRTIPHMEFARPWHCVQLSTGDYVVCHGSEPTEQHRVCLVDHLSGRVIRVHGDKRGDGDEQLNWPNYLAVDSRDNIAVSDRENRRILLLNSSLTRIATISRLSDRRKLSKIRALCIDNVKGRIFVGQFDRKVHILTYSFSAA